MTLKLKFKKKHLVFIFQIHYEREEGPEKKKHVNYISWTWERCLCLLEVIAEFGAY